MIQEGLTTSIRKYFRAILSQITVWNILNENHVYRLQALMLYDHPQRVAL